MFQKLAPRRSNICRPRSTPLPPSSHDCLLLPAEHHLPCIRKKAPRQLRQNRSGGARAANFRSSTTGNGHAACRACWTGIVLALCSKVTLHHLLCKFLDCSVFLYLISGFALDAYLHNPKAILGVETTSTTGRSIIHNLMQVWTPMFAT